MFDPLQLVAVLPELLMAIAALFLLVFGAVRGEKSTKTVLLTAIGVLVVAIYLVLHQPSDLLFVFDGMFRSDAFTQYSKIIILLATLLTLILSAPWLKKSAVKNFEYPILMLLASLGMLLMVSANDFLSVYMALELASLSLYVMAAIDRDNSRSSEAGLKYFILGALASGMFLFGVSLIYGFSGSTSFDGIAGLLTAYADEPVSPGLVIGLVFVLAAFCFKISAVPFHMWTPDVYEGAPTPVVTFFAVAPKVAAITLFTRVMLQPFGEMMEQWQQIIIFVSMASMLIGAFGALRQTNIKRLLAYSSIGHIGYALVGLAVGNEAGAKAMLIYLSLYMFMSVGTFGFVMLMQRGGKPVEEIAELGGLSKTAPKSALFLAIMMFSMAGIPPLAGFFGKMYVFLEALEAGLMSLVIIGLLSSVVAAYYYIKIVKTMYFDDEKDAFDANESLSSRMVLGACALVTVLFVIYPTPLIRVSEFAAQALAL